MARGLDKHQGRVDALNALGRALARRARSRCELCESGGPLKPMEVPPLPPEPELDQALLLCAPCREGLSGRVDSSDARWRFLEGAVWSEEVAVQVSAVRLLRKLAGADQAWAQGTLDGVMLSPEAEELLG